MAKRHQRRIEPTVLNELSTLHREIFMNARRVIINTVSSNGARRSREFDLETLQGVSELKHALSETDSVLTGNEEDV